MPDLNSNKTYFDNALLLKTGKYTLAAKTIMDNLFAGGHKSKLTGYNIEFAEYRQFNQYEDSKYIDWKLYAKSDKLYVKKYEEENVLNISILIDASNSMGFTSRKDKLTKLEYSKFIAACIIYKTIKQRDCFELKTFDDSLKTNIELTNSPAILRQTDAELSAISHSGKTDYLRVFTDYMTSLKKRRLIVILTDFLGESELDSSIKIMAKLAKSGNSVILLHILDEAEINFEFYGSTEFRALETKTKLTVNPEKIRDRYIAYMNDYLRTIANECSANAIYYSLINTSIALEKNILKVFKG